MAISWYHTSVLFYRITHKGPSNWFRMLFEHLVYKSIFEFLVWASTLLFNVGKPTLKSLQLDGIDHGQVKPMDWITEIMYMTVAQVTAENLIGDRSPWECLHTAFWNFWSLLSKVVSSVMGLVTIIHSQYMRHIRDPCYRFLGLEIPIPPPKIFYTYTKLADRHIRLLFIRRSFYFKVSYYLVDVRIEDMLKYEAISYTWGENPAAEEIIVGGKAILTTRTVADILRRRSKLIGLWPGNIRALWIDYLCINQEDIEEKNQQVPMMHEIYEKAHQVMVFLGDGPDASKANWLLFKLCILAEMHSAAELSKRYMLENDSPSWHALGRMISHPWFNRIWIVQEIAAAKKVYVMYGGGLIEWNMMFSAFELFGKPEMTILLPSSDPIMRRDMPLTLEHGHIISYIRNATQMKRRITLTDALSMCSKFRATNPRDKVFALLGLISDDLDVRAWVDYKRTTEDLYRETARYLLAQGYHPLHALSFAGIGYPRALGELPSWVPDWSCPPNSSSFDCAPLFLNQYNASGGRNYDPSILLNAGLNIIRLKGIQADTVGSISRSSNLWINDDPKKKEISNEEMTSWFQEIKNLTEQHISEPYHTGQNREEALWRTFHGDRTVEGRPAPAILGEYYQATKALFTEASIIESSSYDTLADLNIKSSRFFVSASTIRGRRFCITKKGYMGWVPPLTQDEDLVCVFAGVSTPLLLRPYDRENGLKLAYQLVGPCYFNGMMDGEMWGAEREPETFILA